MAESNLGTLPIDGTPVGRRASVGGGRDPKDTYSFRLDRDRNINIALTDKTADANLRLFRDFDGDGIVNGNDRQIAGNVRRGGDNSIDLSSQVRNVDAGSYVIEVESVNDVRTPYDLAVSTTPLNQPSNLLPIDVDLGSFRRTGDSGTVRERNTSQTYSFSVGFAGNFRLSLNGESGDAEGDANVRLIQDLNNNRVVDPGEEIARSANPGTSSEFISDFLSPGNNYFLQVYAAGVGDFYSMTVDLV